MPDKRIALVIPTWNAVKRGVWPQVLAAVDAQTMAVERRIVVDSSSTDSTCAMAEASGWECRKILRRDFNHGTTRDQALRDLAADGIDTVIFLSQDVILETPDTLEKITGFLWSHPVAGCYGRQHGRKTHTLNAWQQTCCYPPVSAVKTLQDVPALGLMTPFFSNAFAAWKTAEVIRCGGFPETGFAEDMLLASEVLNRGGAIGYCAEAAVIHEHSNAPGILFVRGRQIGAFHRRHPELLRQFKRKLPAPRIPVSVWCAFLVKALGYFTGRYLF